MFYPDLKNILSIYQLFITQLIHMSPKGTLRVPTVESFGRNLQEEGMPYRGKGETKTFVRCRLTI